MTGRTTPPNKEDKTKKVSAVAYSSKNVDNFRFELTKLQKGVENFLKQNSISVLVGMGGVGKDTIQIHRAMSGLISGEFEQIIFMRAPVEVGISQGYLPGTEEEKNSVYERVFWENLNKIVDKNVILKYKSRIKFESIAYIRGRDFKHSALIVSEIQNNSLHELISISTRLCESSILMMNGDEYQVDRKHSGLKDYLKVMEGIEGFGFMELGEEFQMRRKMIVDIDKSYRKFLAEKDKKHLHSK